MHAITKLGSIVAVRELSRDDDGHIVAVWGLLDGTTQHGVWAISDIVAIYN
jgi:hypothetical protein